MEQGRRLTRKPSPHPRKENTKNQTQAPPLVRMQATLRTAWRAQAYRACGMQMTLLVAPWLETKMFAIPRSTESPSPQVLFNTNFIYRKDIHHANSYKKVYLALPAWNQTCPILKLRKWYKKAKIRKDGKHITWLFPSHKVKPDAVWQANFVSAGVTWWIWMTSFMYRGRCRALQWAGRGTHHDTAIVKPRHWLNGI